LREWGTYDILAVSRVETASGDRLMSGIDWTGLTPNERLVAEQAVMNLRALTAACDAAPVGQAGPPLCSNWASFRLD